ncbi:DUF4383 domain-containing protein [Arthrobacter castelli]|uniref:DUF4383 domain-containing protein n=1 Tax=Arthrobacter castelli TaxID=271431 RepID=UPI000479AEE2|nr:DUF4383 domain-containing protein [Arthrobacter castelli]
MTTSAAHANRGKSSRSAVQTAALVIGVVFLLVGIAGFIPGITSNYGSLQFAGHESEAFLLGIFQVSILHNIVHLLFGIAGIAMAKTGPASSKYLIIGGIIYAILWIYGLIVSPDSAANLVPLNTADNWLHLGLFIAMVALGFLPGRKHPISA